MTVAIRQAPLIFVEPEEDKPTFDGFKLGDRLMPKRDHNVSWKPVGSKGLKDVDVREGEEFVLVQIWRPDDQAMLRSAADKVVVVDVRALRSNWKAWT